MIHISKTNFYSTLEFFFHSLRKKIIKVNEHELLVGLKFVLLTLMYTASAAILNYTRSIFSLFNVFLCH